MDKNSNMDHSMCDENVMAVHDELAQEGLEAEKLRFLIRLEEEACARLDKNLSAIVTEAAMAEENFNRNNQVINSLAHHKMLSYEHLDSKREELLRELQLGDEKEKGVLLKKATRDETAERLEKDRNDLLKQMKETLQKINEARAVLNSFNVPGAKSQTKSKVRINWRDEDSERMRPILMRCAPIAASRSNYSSVQLQQRAATTARRTSSNSSETATKSHKNYSTRLNMVSPRSIASKPKKRRPGLSLPDSSDEEDHKLIYQAKRPAHFVRDWRKIVKTLEE